jgi:hypothetical protein
MPASPTRFIEKCAQWLPREQCRLVPRGTRGVYALLQSQPRRDKYDVVYIGMSANGIRGRLMGHKKSETKTWDHFSIFKVWDNISDSEVEELEGLFREIYRKDTTANRFNKQKKCKKLQDVRVNKLVKWKKQVRTAE